MTRTFLLREGSPEPDGVGALRRFAVGPFGSCEEVVEFEPPTHLGYVARKGVPVRNYRGDIVQRELWYTHRFPRRYPARVRSCSPTPATMPLFSREVVRYADQIGATALPDA